MKKVNTIIIVKKSFIVKSKHSRLIDASGQEVENEKDIDNNNDEYANVSISYNVCLLRE